MKINFKIVLSLPLMAFFTFLQFASFSQTQSINSINGIVYVDANKNGKKDRNETVLPQVGVSNGVEVVLTNEKGEYSLPVGNDNLIFVVKPEGYQFPLNEDNLPQFYHVHKPLGSPKNLQYPAFEPTSVLSKVDFPLYTAEESKQFSAILFGDPQSYIAEELDYFDQGIVFEASKLTNNIAFGISLGDLVGDDLSLHPGYRKITSKMGLPWHNVMGNHDMNFDVQADSLSDETYEMNFGPANYAFNYGDAHFIILDNILYPDPRDNNGYWGGFRKSQLDFVENNLKLVPKNKLVILAFHIPLTHVNGNTFRPEDRQRLFDLLKDYPNTLSLSAHMHTQTQIFYEKDDGWHQDKPHHEFNVGTTSGDWYSGSLNHQGVPDATMRDGTPRGYAFLHIDGNQYKLAYKVAGASADFQIRLHHPTVVPQGKSSRYAVFANFFMGHEKSEVEYRFDGGDWKKMNFYRGADPFYVANLHPWDNSGKQMAGRRPTDAVISTHLWRISIPNTLPVGKHEIEVRAKDDFGNVFFNKSIIAVEEPLILK